MDQQGDPSAKKQDIEHHFPFRFPRCFEKWQIIKKNTTAKVISVLRCFHDRRTYNKLKCDFQAKLVPTGITNTRKETQVLSHTASSTNPAHRNAKQVHLRMHYLLLVIFSCSPGRQIKFAFCSTSN